MAEYFTVEQSAGISAMMQTLAHRAQTGQDPDEQTVALRMLAAAYESPENPIKPEDALLMASTAGDAPTIASAGDDKFAKLTELLMGDTKTPAEQVSAGQVPKPPVVTVIPTYADSDAINNYAILGNAMSMVELYTNMMIVQENPAGFDITTEAAKAFNVQAKYASQAMMGPMAGFFNFAMGSTRNYSNSLNRSDIHKEFLGKIFEGYGFDEPTIKQLDTILTNFVDVTKTLNPGINSQNTQDFVMFLNLCPEINITGNKDNPKLIYQPTTWLIYIKIAASAYSEAVSKRSSVDKVNFAFQFTTTKCILNVQQFQAHKSRFDQIFEMVTGSNLDKFSTLLTQNNTIKTEAKGIGANAKP